MSVTQKIWKVRRDGVRQRYRMADALDFGTARSVMQSVIQHNDARARERWLSDPRVTDAYMRRLRQYTAEGKTDLIELLIREITSAVDVERAPALRLLAKIHANIDLDNLNYSTREQVRNALINPIYAPHNWYACMQEAVNHPHDSDAYKRMYNAIHESFNKRRIAVAGTELASRLPDQVLRSPIVRAFCEHARQLFAETRPYRQYTQRMIDLTTVLPDMIVEIGELSDLVPLPRTIARLASEGYASQNAVSIINNIANRIRKSSDDASPESLDAMRASAKDALRTPKLPKNVREVLNTLLQRLDGL